MKIAILSDIHGNLEALTEALEYIKRCDVDKIYCLGDIVGYGANPNECVAIIRENCKRVLMGNHDYAAIGLADISYFNEYAKLATLWTRNKLTKRNKDYLDTLPFSHQNDMLIMVHASPTNPVHWYYINSQADALIEMQAFSQRLCFVGHSHVPLVFSESGVIQEKKIKFDKDKKYIINVGSIGQPRDGDNRSSFVIYDTKTDEIEFIRLAYDIHKTFEKIKKAGLPHFLAERLIKGY